MDSRVQFWALLALMISMFVGCGGGEDRPDTAPVSGTVTFEGKPLAGATVSFAGKNASRAGIGLTDSEGKYQLTTFKENDGAVIGSHIVSVTIADTTAGSVENPDEAYAAAMSGGSAKKAEGEFPGRTDLTAEIKAGESNVVDFDL